MNAGDLGPQCACASKGRPAIRGLALPVPTRLLPHARHLEANPRLVLRFDRSIRTVDCNQRLQLHQASSPAEFRMPSAATFTAKSVGGARIPACQRLPRLHRGRAEHDPGDLLSQTVLVTIGVEISVEVGLRSWRGSTPGALASMARRTSNFKESPSLCMRVDMGFYA